MKKLSIIFVLSAVTACHNPSNNDLTKSKVETIKAMPKKNSSSIQKDENNSLKRLIGFWKLKGDENVTFVIDDNTFYYPEHFKRYKYKIIGDSISIKYDDFNESFEFKFKGLDTLFLTGEDGKSEYTMVKK